MRFKNDNINYLIKQLEIRFNDIKYEDIKVRGFTFDKLANGFSQLASFLSSWMTNHKYCRILLRIHLNMFLIE